LLDSVAGFFSRNQATFVRGLHSLLQDAAGGRVYLDFRLIADKRIDALALRHSFTVASQGCKMQTYRSAGTSQIAAGSGVYPPPYFLNQIPLFSV